MSFGKVLIANRGEIAVRVMRTARALGYRTVAVFSEADRGALHVRTADEAVAIGPAAAAESYLSIPQILEAARATGADAIHPGYGFLAENPAFAAACVEASITFIGPPENAIRAMGSKASAKARMQTAGVPTVPGYFGDDASDARLVVEAERVGYPLLVKAVSGGGGRGMRLVREASELPEALAGARRESKSAFSDDTLMLERFIEGGRHIEIQVFADTHGNAIHLGERDCTAQRRRQKVIEESPSPVIDAALRERMGQDAVRAAKAIGYVGAGTVEMIVSRDLEYFFLEMNTRLQVEHPVTELVTGNDLVAWQLRVAAGEPLPLTQEDVRYTGHAIEARLYAEAPYEGFSPQSGRVDVFEPAGIASRPGLRVDTGVEGGDEVTPYYDPMIAKVIAHGRDREEARRRLVLALEDLPVFGLTTNRRFLVDLLSSREFVGAAMSTSTLDEWSRDQHAVVTAPTPDARAWTLAAACLAEGAGAPFRNASPLELSLTIECGEATKKLGVRRHAGATLVKVDGAETRVDLSASGEYGVRYVIDGVARRAHRRFSKGRLELDLGSGPLFFSEVSAYPLLASREDPGEVRSPVAGTIAAVMVEVGQRVSKDDPVAVVEAMKMETRLLAARDGTVGVLHATVGVQVEVGGLVLSLVPLEEVSNG